MISFFHKTIKEKRLNPIESFIPGSWILVENPNEEEIQRLVREFNLDEGLLKDGIDPYEVPRMETDNGSIYLYTRVPYKGTGSVATVPILIVLGENFFMTISAFSLPMFNSMSGGEEELNSTEKTAMLIKAMVETTHSYNGILTDIRKKMRGASALLEDISNKEIAQLVLYESIINDLLSALVPTNIIISNLLSGKIFALSENEHELIEDIFLGIGQLIELSQSTLKNTVNIREAYSTIMTNNLNRVIKLLTILTIVLTIPMIISGFLGMNIPVPLADSPYGFILTVGISIAISIGLFYILKKKKWL